MKSCILWEYSSTISQPDIREKLIVHFIWKNDSQFSKIANCQTVVPYLCSIECSEPFGVGRMLSEQFMQFMVLLYYFSEDYIYKIIKTGFNFRSLPD